MDKFWTAAIAIVAGMLVVLLVAILVIQTLNWFQERRFENRVMHDLQQESSNVEIGKNV
jgi:hypothetical protein